MVKRTLTPAAIVFAVLALMAGILTGAGAQGTDATPAAGEAVAAGTAHPAHIHSGTCDALGDVVFPLTDVTLPEPTLASPEATPTINLTSESVTTVEASLDDIIAGGHAINVHQSAENIDVYIACGDITGPSDDGVLDVDLEELNDSGYTGQATLVDNGDDTTLVTVTLIETAPATPVATPAS